MLDLLSNILPRQPNCVTMNSQQILAGVSVVTQMSSCSISPTIANANLGVDSKRWGSISGAGFAGSSRDVILSASGCAG